MIKKSQKKIPIACILNLDIFQRECHRPLPPPKSRFCDQIYNLEVCDQLYNLEVCDQICNLDWGEGGEDTHAEKYRDSGCQRAGKFLSDFFSS